MTQKSPQVLNRKIVARNDHGSSNAILKISQQFGHLLASEMESEPEGAAVASVVFEEKKESDDIQGGDNNHFYSSPKRGLLSSATSAFLKREVAPRSRHHNRTSPGSTAHDVVTKLQQQATISLYRKSSPIARMRSSSFQEEASLDQGIRYKLTSEPESDQHMKNGIRRKLKQNMGIAEATQRQKRGALDEGSVLSNHFPGTGIISCVLDNVEGTKLFKRFTQCGDMADEASDDEGSEFESSTSGGSISENDEEEYTAFSANLPRRRRTAGRSRIPPSRDSSVEPSVETSVVSSALEEMVARTGIKYSNSENVHMLSTTDDVEMSVHDKVGGTSPLIASSNPAEVPSLENGKVQERSSKVGGKSKWGAANIDFSSAQITSNPATSHTSSDTSFVKMFIENLKTKGDSMLWHKETSVMNPSTITIFLKMGYRCPDGSYFGPRLVWNDIKKELKYGIDLFDIRSLERADPLQLESFPYAMPGRSVCLNLTSGTSFIFEASSEEEAWNFVRGLRWVVARLAFNLVIGNIDVTCELLDLGIVENSGDRSPRSAMEFDWSRAMDDVTDRMVEKTLSSTMV